MAKVTDSTGKEIEIPIEPEKVGELLKEKEELAKLKSELEKGTTEKDAKLKELQEQITKMNEKDTNFSKLRAASKEEREEMLKEFTEREKKIITEIESVRKESEEYRNRNFKTHKDMALKSVAGEDADLKKQIEDAYLNFAGEPKTEQEVTQRIVNAYTLVKGTRPQVNPLNLYAPTGYNEEIMQARKPAVNWTETPEGKAFYEQNFKFKK